MTDISELGLPKRTENALRHAGLNTIEAIKWKLREDFRYLEKLRGIGVKTAEVVRDRASGIELQIEVPLFPPTPRRSRNIGSYVVAISEDEKEIFFWDGKSPMWNFYYKVEGLRK